MRKKLLAVLLVMMVAIACVGCYFVTPSSDKFCSALEKVEDIDSNQYTTWNFDEASAPTKGLRKEIFYFGSGVSYNYFKFDSESNAKTFFDKYYDSFDDVFDDAGFSGDYKRSTSGSRSYVYFDGVIKPEYADKSLFGVGNSFGGAYFQGKTVIVVVEHSDGVNNGHAEKFLDKLNLPHM